MGRVFVLAVDASKLAHKAAKWCCDHLVREDDSVHLLVVTTDGSFGSAITPIAAAGGKTAQCLAAATTKAVHEVLHLVNDKVTQDQFHVSTVKAAPGSKGIAKSICNYARRHGAALIVLGSRGMGDAAASVLSLVGLGSVSNQVLGFAPCPVAVVRGPEIDTKRKPEQHVLLVVDFATRRDALEWVLANALRPADHLHILCIGRPTAKLSEIAGRQLAAGQIHIPEGLAPEQPAAQLCQQVAKYAQDNDISTAVLGWRSAGGVGAALQRLVGRGATLGDLLLRSLECPMIVFNE